MLALWLDTARALALPRRAVPILALAIPLLVAQREFSSEPLALVVGVVMIATFLATGPFAWRLCLPDGSRGPARVLAFTALAVLPGAVGYAVPHALHLRTTFLSDPISLLIATALAVVGSFGLGRDIDLERGLAHERDRADRLAREAERAQLLALRAHLDPHFLFNTLNAIAEWCREDGEVAEAAVLQLSAMLREVFAGVKEPSWPLSRELALLDALFALYRVRDPERFVLDADIVAPADVPVPPLLLLPLAENAVKHGPAAGHKGPVRLAVRDEDGVVVTIRNPGRFEARTGGDGLAMVRRRLALAYEGAASFTIGPDGDGTLATVRLPRRGPEVAT